MEHLILGLIQGITEFLPISSTGHLVLIRNFFGINPESNSAILTVLHLGTLSSLLVVEGKNLTKTTKTEPQKTKEKKETFFLAA